MTKIIQRNDTSANWTTANPILATGEIGWETDTKKFKLGDGTTAWNSLAYAGGEGELDKLLTGSTTDSITTISTNGKSLKLDAPTIEVGENLVNTTSGSNSQLYLKQGDVVAGTNVTIEKTATGIKVNASGGDKPVDAYTKVETDNLLDKKQDKLSPQAPIIFTGGDSLLPPIDSFTSNNVEGLYQITAQQSYHKSDAYQRFKEEIWDGSGVNSNGGFTTLTYKRLDGNKFPTGKTIIEVPFTTNRYCLGSINFYTLNEDGNTLETFSQTYDPVDRNTHINYTLTVNPTQGYSGFKFEWVASNASGIDTSNQNRIGRITIKNSNEIGLNIDDNTIKVNSDGKLIANVSSELPANMVTTDTEQEITGSKLFSNGLKIGGYAGISDNNNVPFIKVVPDGPNTLHAWEIGCNDSAQFKDIMVRRDVNGRYINIDSGNINEYISGSSALENMLTTDTIQTINGAKTFSRPITTSQVISTAGLNLTPAKGASVLLGQNNAGTIMIKGGSLRYNDRTNGCDTYIASRSNGTLALGTSASTALNEVLTTNTAFKQVKLTQAEYDALTTKDTNTMYIIIG